MSTYHVVITGATGMIGRGVLLECLESEHIGKVTLVSRKPIDVQHPKLQEVLLQDFEQLADVKAQLGAPDACFHCMGVSSLGITEAEFTRLTYNVTATFADVMYALNPAMVFVYVSGSGTDSTEKGSVMWARVKGRSENYVLNKGFSKAVMFRPGIIIPEKGITSRTNWYRYAYFVMQPFFGLLKRLSSVTTTTRMGQAMINTLLRPTVDTHLENSGINALAR